MKTKNKKRNAKQDHSDAEPSRKHLGQSRDVELKWLRTHCGPEMEPWRQLAAAWITLQTSSIDNRLWGIGKFLRDYVWPQGFIEPASIFKLGMRNVLPPLNGPKPQDKDGPRTIFYLNPGGIRYRNAVCDFLEWALENDDRFSEETDDGHRNILPCYQHPFDRMTYDGIAFPTQTIRTPLPYKYIVELRQILAPGEHFRDWKWAQEQSGQVGGTLLGDWFEVGKELIDQTDPDCVWRERRVSVKAPGSSERESRTAFEIWSPVRSVALLVKLELPLRTFQVRMLDSGEADTSCIELVSQDPLDINFKWQTNGRRGRLVSLLDQVDRGRTGNRGVFRKLTDPLTTASSVGFFINTNKTADIDKDWDARGYLVEWEHKRLLRWLIKLRNWQAKYNPITEPSLWTALRPEQLDQIKAISDLKMVPPTCFLFRHAAAKKDAEDRALPITSGRMEHLWARLLQELENRLHEQGVRRPDGERLRFIKKVHRKGFSTPFFPLHSLRVSLLTAFALEGGVSIEVLMKLAGHSRLIMAIYYQKVGSIKMGQLLDDATQRMLRDGDRAVQTFLMQKSLDSLVSVLVAMDNDALKAAVPEDLSDRSPAGWLRVLGGWCIVGGNTTPVDGNKQIGGCYNGGQALRAVANPRIRTYAGVPPRQCFNSKCRWAVTRPEYLPELHAKLNNLFYHQHASQRRFNGYERELDRLQREKYTLEKEGKPFTKRAELERLLSLHESAAAELNELCTGIYNLLKIIDRCIQLLNRPVDSNSSNQQLLLAGSIQDAKLVLQQSGSELLQLAGVCEDAEIYPELDVDHAVVRRSQLLDQMLIKQGTGQPLFLSLDEATQHKLGNRLLRDLANTLSPEDRDGGYKRITSVIEAGQELGFELRKTVENVMASAQPQLQSLSVKALLCPESGI